MQTSKPILAGAFLVVFGTGLHADSLLDVTVLTQGLDWSAPGYNSVSLALSGLDYDFQLEANTAVTLEINPFVFTVDPGELLENIHPGELVRLITLNGVPQSVSQPFNFSARDKDTLHIHGYESLPPVVFGLGGQGEILLTPLSTSIVGNPQGAAGTIMATFLWVQPGRPIEQAPEPLAFLLMGFGLVTLGFLRPSTLRRFARRPAWLRAECGRPRR